MQQFEGFIERASVSGGDVENLSRGLRRGSFAGQQICLHRVVNVSEVAALLAVAEDRGLLATQHHGNELGEDTGIGRGGILPRAEDVEVAQGHGLKLVATIKRNQVMLAGQLGDGIGRNGIGLHGLDLGQGGSVAVCGRRCRVDDAFYFGIARGH